MFGQAANMIAAILLLAANAPKPGCDLANINSARDLHETLGRRAAMIVAAASVSGPKADATLGRLLDPTATFDLGAGDVGRPLGKGLPGVRSLAITMNADQFRFLGWDYMDREVDACSKQSVKVDFVSSTDRQVSQLEFTFEQGRLVTAIGWQRSFESGSLPTPASTREGS
jgi:hypothetical protein